MTRHIIPRSIKLTEIATTVQFVCHYWKHLKILPNSPSGLPLPVLPQANLFQIISS